MDSKQFETINGKPFIKYINQWKSICSTGKKNRWKLPGSGQIKEKEVEKMDEQIPPLNESKDYSR